LTLRLPIFAFISRFLRRRHAFSFISEYTPSIFSPISAIIIIFFSPPTPLAARALSRGYGFGVSLALRRQPPLFVFLLAIISARTPPAFSPLSALRQA